MGPFCKLAEVNSALMKELKAAGVVPETYVADIPFLVKPGEPHGRQIDAPIY